ncbi:MFS transporter [Acidihalobacter ferrooxydans]|uniref:MFS transporter n=1 Tax=Acidihalobacter ferrooxydans TaxID=1765967 RepID=A0A1P8UEB0_9GAMM|nr:MFS transporter [Acidihalobacter ferrooxydans]APZ42171.1 MFS transporter [Acidihalobacter ferrooxydans]
MQIEHGETAPAGTTGDGHELSGLLVLVMALACGITVANLYYAQPLLDTLASVFGVSTGAAGLIVTFTQLGYALGLVFLVPLGDILNRRRLIVALMLSTAVALAAAALADSIGLFLAASLAIGTTSVVAMVLVPFAASLAADYKRGRVVGQIMSGLLMGILLGRTVSGLLADAAGWRAVFWFGAALMLVQAAIMWRLLPDVRNHGRISYPALLISVLPLLREEPVLRRRIVYGATLFATFSALWTCLPFLLNEAPYHYGDAVIGAFGLIGAAGAMSASLAGRMADRGWARGATGVFIVSVLLSFGLMDVAGHVLLALIVGIALMDFGVQGAHITNQSEIYRLRPDARSRITTAYMFFFFIGAAVGSSLSAYLYQFYGWAGVCLLCMGFAGVALAFWLTEFRRVI